jgi:plastocyanin
MRAPMIRKLLPLAVVLALGAAACAETPKAELEFGSGARFVPLVADPLNNAGVDPSVIVGSDGTPTIAYFAFNEQTEGGVPPATRPVTAPSLPGVLLAQVSPDGIWTRGAIAIAAAIPNVNVSFNPAYEPSVAKLTAANVTGLQLVADGDTYHAAWGSAQGLYYATGSLDPSTTDQATVTQVSKTPPHGLSIGLDGSGTPWIAYYSSVGSQASVQLATPTGSSWTDDSIADASIPNCENCRTAVVTSGADVVVAYVDGSKIMVASNDHENGWSSFGVGSSTGGEGLSGAPAGDGAIGLTYYEGTQVTYATGSPTGPFSTSAVADVASGASAADGARTSVSIADDGTAFVGWQDDGGVRFASGGSDGGFTAIDTAPDTQDGEMPAVAALPDGSAASIAWYDPTPQDLVVGIYGELNGLALAQPSPTPSGPPQTVAPSNPTCASVQSGKVTVTASGIAFDTGCIDAPAGQAFTIDFENKDAGVQHNIAIFPSEQDLQNPLFRGDLVTGPGSATYDVDALDAGEFYFHCDVHPTMNGTINVGKGGGTGASGATGTTGATGSTGGATGSTGGATGATGGGGGGNGSTTVNVTASGIAFDTSTISLPAKVKTTIHFDNQDAGVQHNIAIFTDDTMSDLLFRGDLVTGPGQADYSIPALDAGEYYFHCDVHPTMNGTVKVA